MLPGATEAKVQQAANDVLATLGIVNSSVQMTPTTIQQNTDAVTIDITTSVASNSLGFVKYFSSGNLSTSITLTRELQPGRF